MIFELIRTLSWLFMFLTWVRMIFISWLRMLSLSWVRSIFPDFTLISGLWTEFDLWFWFLSWCWLGVTFESTSTWFWLPESMSTSDSVSELSWLGVTFGLISAWFWFSELILTWNWVLRVNFVKLSSDWFRSLSWLRTEFDSISLISNLTWVYLE